MDQTTETSCKKLDCFLFFLPRFPVPFFGLWCKTLRRKLFSEDPKRYFPTWVTAFSASQRFWKTTLTPLVFANSSVFDSINGPKKHKSLLRIAVEGTESLFVYLRVRAVGEQSKALCIKPKFKLFSEAGESSIVNIDIEASSSTTSVCFLLWETCYILLQVFLLYYFLKKFLFSMILGTVFFFYITIMIFTVEYFTYLRI